MQPELVARDLSAERLRWKSGAVRFHFGVCSRCRRSRNNDGRILLVARQRRSRLFLCFDCWLTHKRRPR